MIILHHLGENITTLNSINGKKYLYEYKRTINNQPTVTTFSNNLNELKNLYKIELENDQQT